VVGPTPVRHILEGTVIAVQELASILEDAFAAKGINHIRSLLRQDDAWLWG
jgi:hypothetical protein